MAATNAASPTPRAGTRTAAIAAAGAVKAKKEDLAYTASLVIIFALPSIFLLPWLAGLLGLTDAQTGAWIGGNIDTTAAVTAAGLVNTTFGHASAARNAVRVASSSQGETFHGDNASRPAPWRRAARRSASWPPWGRSEMTYHAGGVGCPMRGL